MSGKKVPGTCSGFLVVLAGGGHDGFRQGARRADLFLCFFVDFVVSPFFVVPSLWF